jgi:hypothetical protein
MTPETMALRASNRDASDLSGSGDSVDYELLFDSEDQAIGDGLRNSVIAARQLLFRIGSVFLDLEVGRESDSNQASIIGQMLDSSSPGHPPAGVRIALLDRNRPVASASSNDHGEFQLQFTLKANLKLSVELDRKKPVHLPITNPIRGKSRSSESVKKCHPLGDEENRTLAL